MYKGKYSNKKRRLTPWAALALALMLTLSVGGTVAYLFTTSDTVTNIFTPAPVTCEIVETMNTEKTEKTNVTVKNTSDVPVYIRVALVPTWEDADGNAVAVSASLADLNIAWGSGWHLHTDGYYYYTQTVAAGDNTSDLIETATVTTSNGYYMDLQILAQAIQAEPSNAVFEAWGFVPGSN